MIVVQIFFALLLLGPLVWGCINWINYKGLSTQKNIANYPTMINSAVLYAIAFNLIFFLQELFLVLGKKVLDLEAFLYHNNHTWVGEHPMTSLMQGSGALAIFLIGLVFLVMFQFMRTTHSIWKLFFLWVAFHGLVQSLPQVTIGYLDPGTDVGEALVGYLNLSQPLLMILSITSVIATAMVSIWFSSQLLGFVSVDIDISGPKAKFKYIRIIAVGAATIGSLLVVPFRIPPISQAITPFIILFFTVPWIWCSAAASKHIKPTTNSINEKIYWIPIAFLILLLIFFQWVLAPGVKF